MLGAGIAVFAVWNYIITKVRDGHVEVNPKLLAFTLGGTEVEVRAALEFLESPDPNSRSKLEEGRRLVREGEFQYRVVNWEYYQKIRNEEDRREYNRIKQAEYRSRKQDGDPKIAARARARINREEAIQSEVRKKYNPGFVDGNPKEIEVKPGEGIKEALKRKWAKDREVERKDNENGTLRTEIQDVPYGAELTEE